MEGRTEFRVVNRDNNKLERVVNYPNPFTTNTEFSFEHDLAGLELQTTISIYTISGKLVRNISERKMADGYRFRRSTGMEKMTLGLTWPKEFTCTAL